MARVSETVVTQSVLDRLLGIDDWPATRAQSVRFLKDSLRRDLEWLLNTRRPPMPQLVDYPAACASTLNYGLPDLSAMGLASAADHERLREAIVSCVRCYEPRLVDVTVSIDDGSRQDRRLRFHIQGRVQMDPAPEDISFDTVLELSSGEYLVK
jgi:type VI secretion system protein ImpF